MTVSTMTPSLPEVFPSAERKDLTALDRCDSCGARAWVRAVLPASELLFCAHHASRHIEALSSVALFVQDDREIMDS